jgi:putative transposase
VTRQTRNLLMNLEDRADSFKFLIRDRDAKFTAAFGAVLTAAGIRTIKTPVQAPRANAIAERWIAGTRRECPGRILITGERHLRLVLTSTPITATPTARTGRCNKGRPPGARIHPIRARTSGSCAGTGSVV